MTQDEIIEPARQPRIIVTGDAVLKLCQLVAEKEREACAKLCEDISNTRANMSAAWRNGCRDVATEIRARGQA
jgi:hypothetical protein